MVTAPDRRCRRAVRKDHRAAEKGALDGCSLEGDQAHADAASVSTGVNSATSDAGAGGCRGQAQAPDRVEQQAHPDHGVHPGRQPERAANHTVIAIVTDAAIDRPMKRLCSR